MAAVIINKHKKRKKDDADKPHDTTATLYVSLGPSSCTPLDGGRL